MRRLGLILALAMSSACDDGTVSIVVDLYSDYQPGTDVARAEVDVEGVLVTSRRPIAADAALIDGIRVADIAGLEPSSPRAVTARLFDADGAVVATRTVLVDNSRSTVVPLLMSRRCSGVVCDEGLECLAGRCVAQDCVSGLEPSCPPGECMAASDCVELSECSSARCNGAVCIYDVDRSACAAGEVCALDRGCEPETAAPGVELLAPPNGVATGSAWVPTGVAAHPLAPRLRWRPAAGADAYRLQMDDDCAAGALDACAFGSPEVDVIVSETEHTPDALAVSMSAPMGRLYGWRVAPCSGGSCTEAWSVPRYLEVGRVRGDLDGNGYPELAVGTRPEFASGPAGEYVYVFERDPLMQRTVLYRTTAAAQDEYSAALATGDFDADGFFDLAVAAPDVGEVHVYPGGPGSVDGGRVVVLAPTGVGSLREWMASGDVDGDGFDDLWIAGTAGTGLLRGGTSGLADAASTVIPNTIAQRGVALLGDVDGDGYVDLARTLDGSVEIFRGGPTPSTSPDHTVTHPTDPYFGVTLGGVDWNGDGYGDVAVGTGGDFNVGGLDPTPLGNVFVALGGPTGPSATPEVMLVQPSSVPARRFGWTLRSADLRSDGAESLIVGAADTSGSDGTVAVYAGDPGALEELSDPNPGGWDRYGEDVALIDLESDGYADVVVGAGNGGADGQIWVFSRDAGGTTGTTSREHPNQPAGGGSWGWFGASLTP